MGHNLTIFNMWNVEHSINGINQTYELDADIPTWNYRAVRLSSLPLPLLLLLSPSPSLDQPPTQLTPQHVLLDELRRQTELYACSGGVWTQTTDVEGEVNGLVSYDRRIIRADKAQWKKDIQALYDAAKARG
jgi:hypothetical protein